MVYLIYISSGYSAFMQLITRSDIHTYGTWNKKLTSIGSNCSGNLCLPTVDVFSPLTDTVQEVVELLVSGEKQQRSGLRE